MSMNLDELERKARAATPGPWADDGCTVTHGHPMDQIVDYVYSRDDAAFIAAASPDVVLELVRRVREGERLLGEARDSVEECVQEHAANWGERLMHKQEPAIKNLKEIDAFLAEGGW